MFAPKPPPPPPPTPARPHSSCSPQVLEDLLRRALRDPSDSGHPEGTERRRRADPNRPGHRRRGPLGPQLLGRPARGLCSVSVCAHTFDTHSNFPDIQTHVKHTHTHTHAQVHPGIVHCLASDPSRFLVAADMCNSSSHHRGLYCFSRRQCVTRSRL